MRRQHLRAKLLLNPLRPVRKLLLIVLKIAGAVAMEDASLTTKGVVKLSSAVDSTSESLAATPKAVKAANDNANIGCHLTEKLTVKH